MVCRQPLPGVRQKSINPLAFASLVLLTQAVGIAGELQVGAAAVNLQADDTMVIGGSILGGRVRGQEGELRVVAVVLEHPGSPAIALVTCDVLMLNRDIIDPAVAEIARRTGLETSHVLVNATHTHHAPSTVTVHGYQRDERFCQQVKAAIIESVVKANERKVAGCRFFFALGREETVGSNSRLLLPDGLVAWLNPGDAFVRPTGPFDPELPLLTFRDRQEKPVATIFNHSTHTIGALSPGKRSPAFYGLAAQALEKEVGGIFSFVEGASGSTHNRNLTAEEAYHRIKQAVRTLSDRAEVREVTHLRAIKHPFRFRVRDFHEAEEDAKVVAYCTTHAGRRAAETIEVFRKQRQLLLPQRGEERESWIQVLLIGEVAVVGVPAEFFTKLGLDIKNRSPYRYTYIAELANDWIGYLPDRDAHTLGGYQTWTGLHSYAEPGTGERVVEETLRLLQSLRLPDGQAAQPH
jgi:neutral ceramidase